MTCMGLLQFQNGGANKRILIITSHERLVGYGTRDSQFHGLQQTMPTRQGSIEYLDRIGPCEAHSNLKNQDPTVATNNQSQTLRLFSCNLLVSSKTKASRS